DRRGPQRHDHVAAGHPGPVPGVRCDRPCGPVGPDAVVGFPSGAVDLVVRRTRGRGRRTARGGSAERNRDSPEPAERTGVDRKEKVMWWTIQRGSIFLALIGAIVLMLTGCGQAENKKGHAKDKSVQVALAKPADQKDHDHSGWWCDEHGVPEEICSQCNAKVAAAFKKKGDWCNEHDRAKSECFLCDPKLKEKFAAQYRVKYGK